MANNLRARGESASMDSFMADSRTESYMTKQQEIEAFERLRNGDESAKEELYLGLKGAVVQYAAQFFGSKLPLEDLVQAANLGVLKAIEKFDHTKGARLYSYAKWWMLSEMQRHSLEAGYSVALPHRYWTESMACLKAETQLMAERNNDMYNKPTDDEVAERAGQSGPVAETARIMRYGVSSLDAPKKRVTATDGDDDGYTMMDAVGLKSHATAEDDLNAADIKRIAMDIIAEFPTRTQRIMKMHYGIGTDEPMRLVDIAEELMLSRERVRQIKEDAFERVLSQMKFEELRESAKEVLN